MARKRKSGAARPAVTNGQMSQVVGQSQPAGQVSHDRLDMPESGLLEIRFASGFTIFVDAMEVMMVAEPIMDQFGIGKVKGAPLEAEQAIPFGRKLREKFIELGIFPNAVWASGMIATEAFVRCNEIAQRLKKNMLVWQTSPDGTESTPTA